MGNSTETISLILDKTLVLQIQKYKIPVYNSMKKTNITQCILII